ncbi:MAG: hypothetical protein H0W01_11980 [Pseudonocardiales bacterium]|nr:hypothetical protein [Pseudonocardiales bacterium]
MTTAASAQPVVLELLELVGLDAQHAMRHPRELSGGQHERVAVAETIERPDSN